MTTKASVSSGTKLLEIPEVLSDEPTLNESSWNRSLQYRVFRRTTTIRRSFLVTDSVQESQISLEIKYVEPLFKRHWRIWVLMLFYDFVFFATLAHICQVPTLYPSRNWHNLLFLTNIVRHNYLEYTRITIAVWLLYTTQPYEDKRAGSNNMKTFMAETSNTAR